MPSAAAETFECIRDVWEENMEEEFKTLRTIIQDYPYIAMDTEFPGIVYTPVGDFRSTSDYQYQNMKTNVDVLKIIQIGLTFLNETGEAPSPVSTWQFNFKYNLDEEIYAANSIDLLRTCGIQFHRHQEEGIEVSHFAELLTSSGIVLCDNVRWLSFHSAFDFGYLLKILTSNTLPDDQDEFFEMLRLFFGNIYDVKYLMKSCKNLKGGLQELADQLEIVRIGPQHQAGSDSLLTGAAFFKMREMFFEDHIDDAKYSGHLFGLTSSSTYDTTSASGTPLKSSASASNNSTSAAPSQTNSTSQTSTVSSTTASAVSSTVD